MHARLRFNHFHLHVQRTPSNNRTAFSVIIKTTAISKITNSPIITNYNGQAQELKQAAGAQEGTVT